MTRGIVLGSVGGAPFSLEAYAKTSGKSGCLSSITPRKFDVGDEVKHLNSDTMKPHPNIYTVLAVEWYPHINKWFYETLPGVWTNEDYLVFWGGESLNFAFKYC